MLIDAAAEWRRLTEQYRAMSDDQLHELAEDFNDLTVTAQQVLRGEMSSRGLRDPQAPRPEIVHRSSEVQQSSSAPRKNFDLLASPLANSYVVPSESDEHDQEDTSTYDYTWKTLLCECNDVAGAQQLSEALARAGIESWVESLPNYSIGIGNPRVLVPADQLEQARTIADRPIPQDIVDESNQPITEYQAPKCPKCGAEDPTLEAAEPTNTWLCEECGTTWADPASDPTGDSGG